MENMRANAVSLAENTSLQVAPLIAFDSFNEMKKVLDLARGNPDFVYATITDEAHKTLAEVNGARVPPHAPINGAETRVEGSIIHVFTPVIDNGRNRGKGYSVRQGVLASRGRHVAFVDADLSLPIEDADRFGLSQLYQLRGRVGRAKLRAYALFTLPAQKPITIQAERRLKVLQSLDTLGAGFQLASHDLDIRGAGNLLGEEQSGHIKEVGFELYQQMLEEAVLSLKAGITAPVADRWSPQITIGTALLIPEEYVADLSVRLALYRRLAEIEDEHAIDGFAAELVDRFGKLPQEVEHLLQVVAIKALSRRANVEKVEAGPKGIVLSFRDNVFANPEGLIAFIREQGSAVRMRNDPKTAKSQQLVFFGDWPRPQDRLKGTAAVLRKLASIADQAKAA
jgi:transcription-repair coupling factor (superfamily II helicase)